MADEDDRGGTRRAAATPRARPVTADWLFRAGAHYLERYASTSANLRAVLERKVARRAAALGAEPAEFRGMIDATMERFHELKLLDDRAFAEARLVSLRRRGASTRMAGVKLASKGVPRDLVEATLLADETSEADAAHALARRRRLGVHRSGGADPARRDRDIAAMVRAGFRYDLARDAVDGVADED